MPEEKKRALGHSIQGAVWRKFINCDAKLALSCSSWQLGKQRNRSAQNVSDTDLKFLKTMNSGPRGVIL